VTPIAQEAAAASGVTLQAAVPPAGAGAAAKSAIFAPLTVKGRVKAIVELVLFVKVIVCVVLAVLMS